MRMSQLILITFFPLTAMFGEMRTYLSKDGKKNLPR